MEKKLRPYYFKRNLRDSHCDYGIVADSLEKCPIGKVEKIGCACTYQSCCKGHAPFMRIVEDINSWVMCEETTKMMDQDQTDLLGQQLTCVEEYIP